MAIAFARWQPISRSRQGNSVRSAAYAARTSLIDSRTGYLYSWKNDGTLEHYSILLPEGADPRFTDPGFLWSSVELAEKRRDACVAYEIVLALPGDASISHDDRVELARSFTQRFVVSKGLPAQVVIHRPRDHSDTLTSTTNFHAHILIATRQLENDRFAAKKSQDLVPKFAKFNGRPLITSADEWGKHWATHQEEYFARRGKDLVVDPIAPHPASHLGPKRFLHPFDPRRDNAAPLRGLNRTVARNPSATYEHLRRQYEKFDERALNRFLAKHLSDPTERRTVAEGVCERYLNDLRRQSAADKVPSGWRDATIEDIARQLSPEYAGHVARAKVLQKRLDYAAAVKGRRMADIANAETLVAQRRQQIGRIRVALHLLVRASPRDSLRRRLLRDQELENYERVHDRAKRGAERWSIRHGSLEGELRVVKRLLDHSLALVRGEAEVELIRRHTVANKARDALRSITSSVYYSGNLRPQTLRR
jgi:hypothetical protein